MPGICDSAWRLRHKSRGSGEASNRHGVKVEGVYMIIQPSLT